MRAYCSAILTMTTLLLHLCLWCSPVEIHAHAFGQQWNYHVRPRDKRVHKLKATGLPPAGIEISGGGEMGFSTTVPISEIEIDGRVRKVKP